MAKLLNFLTFSVNKDSNGDRGYFACYHVGSSDFPGQSLECDQLVIELPAEVKTALDAALDAAYAEALSNVEALLE